MKTYIFILKILWLIQKYEDFVCLVLFYLGQDIQNLILKSEDFFIQKIESALKVDIICNSDSKNSIPESKL